MTLAMNLALFEAASLFLAALAFAIASFRPRG